MKALGPLTWRQRAGVGVRVLAAIAGSWGVVALAVPLLALALSALGMARSEATVLAMMLGFVAYLVALLWAFSVRSLARLLLVLALAGAGASALLHALAP